MVIGEWQPSDEPWAEQAKWSPSCLYLIHLMGREFIEQCQRLLLIRNSDPLFSRLESTYIVYRKAEYRARVLLVKGVQQDGGRLPASAEMGTIGVQNFQFSSDILLEFVGCCVKLVSDCWSRREVVFLYVKVYSCVSVRE